MSSGEGIPEELLSSLVHELKTPLSVILGYAELLETRSDEQTRRKAAAGIRDAAERLRSTVDRLLADTRSL